MTAPAPLVIVAAAIVDGDPPRVLAAQRAYPEELAGLWELPGGKVHPGESDEDALVRECREELAVDVALGSRLGTDTPVLDGAAVLRVWWARVVRGAPQPLEHAELRWLAREDVDSVAWLPSDAPVIVALRGEWPARGARTQT